MRKGIKEGDKFNKLLAIRFSHKSECKRVIYWVFLCDCGNMSTMPKNNVMNNRTISCGCQRLKNLVDRSTKHGEARRGKRERLNSIWVDMRKRCKDKTSKNYGARGIKVCEEWNNSYAIFADWARANGYNDEMSIDRIDNDKGYSPDNCRWISGANQLRNKRTSRILEYKGIRMCASRWAEAYNIPYKTFYRRIQSGWQMDRALTN